jgi:hypothetical protein
MGENSGRANEMTEQEKLQSDLENVLAKIQIAGRHIENLRDVEAFIREKLSQNKCTTTLDMTKSVLYIESGQTRR